MKLKYPYIGGTRWNFMKFADIPSKVYPGDVYLRRLRVLQTPWFAIYLHWIMEPDTDRFPHDHPFVFWSYIVKGGYTEELWEIEPRKNRSKASYHRRWGPMSFHKMPKTMAHMIISLKPGTVTLVFCGPKKGPDWGFYSKTEFIPWQKYDSTGDALG